MDLTKELEIILKSSMGRTNSPGTLFWKLLDVTIEMAKRIESLEQCAMGYIERIDKLLLDNDQG